MRRRPSAQSGRPGRRPRHPPPTSSSALRPPTASARRASSGDSALVEDGAQRLRDGEAGVQRRHERAVPVGEAPALEVVRALDQRGDDVVAVDLAERRAGVDADLQRLPALDVSCRVRRRCRCASGTCPRGRCSASRRSRRSAGTRRTACADSVSAPVPMPKYDTWPYCAGSVPSALSAGTNPELFARNSGSSPHSSHVGSASLRSPASSSRMNGDQISIAASPAKYVARVVSTFCTVPGL